ncbi:hypothetical protein AAFF_G00290270 [Aldrovandia affinis]|uniref:Uncharacterized protein n=1 Tax=Aldrovandia affinis TaxID=143900 RepID=A0AAD7R9I8_9TELE|nr:hypothetical protein AAFF_G00290270 [Aldrovandia affinis]
MTVSATVNDLTLFPFTSALKGEAEFAEEVTCEDDGEPHSCEQLLETFSKPWPDLADTRLPNSDLIFCGWLCTEGQDHRRAPSGLRCLFSIL